MTRQARVLSLRNVTPGSDRTFVRSEKDFAAGLELVVAPEYDVRVQPNDLRRLFSGCGDKTYGVVPEASITARNGRKLFFEVKRQGARGNAEERAMKHHTSRFQAVLKGTFNLDYHPFFTVFCDDLATNPRYTAKFPYYIEPTHYLCWVDYDLDLLGEWISGLCERYLCG